MNMSIGKLEERILYMTGVSVLIIASCSFLLSFFNLQATAIQAGINTYLSWAWPICIDCLLIAGSLMILYSSIRNEPTYMGWLVLLGFTLVSTLFNIAHSPSDLLSQAAHAVPPLALCVSIELLMMCVRSHIHQENKKSVHIATNDSLNAHFPIENKISIDLINKAQSSNRNKSKKVHDYLKKNPRATYKEIMKECQVSSTTVARVKAEIRQEVAI